MSILDAVFGRRARSAVPLASDEIVAEIEIRRGTLVSAKARVGAAAAKRRAACDALDPTGIVAAESDATLAQAEVETAENAVRALEAAHGDALAREATAALTARRAAADHKAQSEGAKLLAAYDGFAAQLAAVLAAKEALDREVSETNRALKEAGRRDEAIASIDRRFRFQPGKQDPDRVEYVDELQEKVGDEWSRATQLRRSKDGSMESIYPTRTITREVRRPGRKRPDNHLPLLGEIRLPPGRIGGKSHWPREA
ncbi:MULTISPECIES: hypothetical protein [unclassified Methylobacterium]|uniref:hypothetical protein n=1 Tax=unclassified Methylobacterium TaxID=2615210 RepID=UPI002269BE0A|nr:MULTISPECIES: hypothetical protein [unclassified Methylobacterium]